MGQTKRKVFVRRTSLAAGGSGHGSVHCQVWECLKDRALESTVSNGYCSTCSSPKIPQEWDQRAGISIKRAKYSNLPILTKIFNCQMQILQLKIILVEEVLCVQILALSLYPWNMVCTVFLASCRRFISGHIFLVLINSLSSYWKGKVFSSLLQNSKHGL